nr:4Fe-4S dicluster domain-containing protein [Bacillota bacterium]
DVCPAYLTPTEIKKAYEYKDNALMEQLGANKCVQCGLCSYVCPSHVEITDFVIKAKDTIRAMKKGV